MTDILERLRSTRWHGTAFSREANDAAEEIELLKNELAEKNQFLDQLVETLSHIRPDAFANRRAD